MRPQSSKVIGCTSYSDLRWVKAGTQRECPLQIKTKKIQVHMTLDVRNMIDLFRIRISSYRREN